MTLTAQLYETSPLSFQANSGRCWCCCQTFTIKLSQSPDGSLVAYVWHSRLMVQLMALPGQDMRTLGGDDVLGLWLGKSWIRDGQEVGERFTKKSSKVVKLLWSGRAASHLFGDFSGSWLMINLVGVNRMDSIVGSDGNLKGSSWRM